jgi:uncharacterized protein (TIGR00255 family)
MTGFGAAEVETGPVRARVECRSVNSRYLELKLRLPPALLAAEAEFKRRASLRIRRGRVEVAVTVRTELPPPASVRLNSSLAGEYVKAARALSSELGITGEFRLPEVMRLPGVVEAEPVEGDDRLELFAAPALEALDRALEMHDAERLREGGRLVDDLVERLDRIEELRGEISGLAGRVPAAARERLLERIAKISPGAALDPGRLEAEVALLADRCDITEELVRLGSHLEASRGIVGGDGEPAGKRFEFLLQEFQRETNTINSKSTDLEITRAALAIKAEIEKMREQVQNLE